MSGERRVYENYDTCCSWRWTPIPPHRTDDNRAAICRPKPFPGFGCVFASICGSGDGGVRRRNRNHLRLEAGSRDCRDEIRDEDDADDNDTSSKPMTTADVVSEEARVACHQIWPRCTGASSSPRGCSSEVAD